MLAEIDTESYDVAGKPVAEIRQRHRLAGPNVPFGRFSQPLTYRAENLDSVRCHLAFGRSRDETMRLPAEIATR